MNKIRFKYQLWINKFLYQENFIYSLIFKFLFLIIPFLVVINPFINVIISKNTKVFCMCYTLLIYFFCTQLVKIPLIKKRIITPNLGLLSFNFIFTYGYVFYYHHNFKMILILFILSIIIQIFITIKKTFFSDKNMIFLRIFLIVLTFENIKILGIFFVIVLINLLKEKKKKQIIKINNPILLENKIYYCIPIILLLILYPMETIHLESILDKNTLLLKIISTIKIISFINFIFILYISERLIVINLDYYQRFLVLDKYLYIKNVLLWVSISITYLLVASFKYNLSWIETTSSILFIVFSIVIKFLFRLNSTQSILLNLVIWILLFILIF